MPSKKARAKILIVVGTRPEVIKMAPVYLQLIKEARFEVQLCATGQHSDLLTLALQDFDLVPDYKLELMEHGQGLGSLTSRAISGLEGVIQNAKPDAVLVHGDTTTTLSAALAAYYAQIPVGHVEAGLRTRDIYSPFPEEFNRQAVSRIANWNFAPTAQARQNLLDEGVDERRIAVTGNTIVDSILLLVEESRTGRLDRSWVGLNKLLGFDPRSQKTVLITTHRRENLGEGVANIFQAVQDLAKRHKEARFVLPLHPNPQVRLAASGISELENVSVIDPLGYRNFMLLLSASSLVITDSGGIQEEAVTLGKKVLVTRVATERPEGLLGSNLEIVGSTVEEIIKTSERELTNSETPRGIQIVSEVYGDGRASKRISELLASDLLSSRS
jgi:UDP-N-acetylglucosamine 2-epimerase (non-hydrolysing)